MCCALRTGCSGASPPSTPCLAAIGGRTRRPLSPPSGRSRRWARASSSRSTWVDLAVRRPGRDLDSFAGAGRRRPPSCREWCGGHGGGSARLCLEPRCRHTWTWTTSGARRVPPVDCRHGRDRLRRRSERSVRRDCAVTVHRPRRRVRAARGGLRGALRPSDRTAWRPRADGSPWRPDG